TNDSFGSILNQVKQAAAAWNSVDSSDLRVAFGGVEAPNQPANTPTADVIFTDDLPPGLLGMGAPTKSSPSSVAGPHGPFFPIVRSTVMLPNDTSRATASYLQAFFTTCVHEMGHALGLQHTFTASAMSQGTIRNTSRARPLDADDIASLASLYGKANW